MIHVTDFMFNDHTIESVKEYESWKPEAPEILDEWFQVHACTYQAMSFLSNKERSISNSLLV